MVKQIVFLVNLIYMSIQDVKSKSISLKSVLMMAVTMLISSFIGISGGKLCLITDCNLVSIKNVAGSIVFTFVLTVYVKVTKSFGIGDVFIILITSVFMGCFYAIRMFITALIILLTVVLAGIGLKKISYKQQIPFIPYMLIGGLGAIVFV